MTAKISLLRAQAADLPKIALSTAMRAVRPFVSSYLLQLHSVKFLSSAAGEDFRSVCCPMTRQLREHIENCVLEKYSASADPKEWVVEFKNGDEMSIKMEVSEFTRADAIVLAKGKIEAKYGKKVADGLELVSATEK